MAVADDRAKAPATASQKSGSHRSTVGRLQQFLAPSSSRMYRVSVVAVASTQFEVVGIRDKHWISLIEAPSDAVQEARSLYNAAQELLAQSCAASDHQAMHEISLFLLQWYRSRYLRPSKTIYAHLLATLAGSIDRKFAMDATYTLYKLHVDGVLHNDFWLRSVSHLNSFLTVLSHPSATTAYYAAHVLNLVLEVAETESQSQLVCAFDARVDNKHSDGVQKVARRVSAQRCVGRYVHAPLQHGSGPAALAAGAPPEQAPA